MKYGYAVIREYGQGEPWWDEYYTITDIQKVRLFKTESERDNGIKLEKQRLKTKGIANYEISKFITKG